MIVKVEQYIQEIIPQIVRDWHLPGMSVGIISHGEIVFSGGFGVRDVESQLPADEYTLYGIGSTTKAMTSVILGMLVDEGKISWDQRVIDILPDFQLMDLYATRQITIRDTLRHSCGLAKHDLTFILAPVGKEQTIYNLRYSEPLTSFRYVYNYNNHMYAVAGAIIEKVCRKSYEEALQERIFTPLGMRNPNASVIDMQRSENFAPPHIYWQGKLERLPFRNIDAVASAGSVNMCVADYLKWLQFNIQHGKVDGKTLISSRSLSEIYNPQTAIPNTEPQIAPLISFPEWGCASYGMGWVVNSYRGYRCLQHAGGIDGLVAFIAFLPEIQSGVVLMTNLNRAGVHFGLTFDLLDSLLGVESVDWVGRIRMMTDLGAQAAVEAETRRRSERISGTCPSHPLAAYVGEYTNPMYGKIIVRLEGETLSARFNDTETSLTHYHYDTFEFRCKIKEPLIDLLARFTGSTSGQITRLLVPLDEQCSDIVFTRKS